MSLNRGTIIVLQEELARLQREKGEADGMVQILRAKLSEAEEDNFDLRANMMTIEAEIQYSSTKKEEEMRKQVTSLESKMAFLTDQLKNAERVKLRALREVEELQQKQLLEQKRLDAEKRLLATKKRKHESVMVAASQSLMATRMPAKKSTATTSMAVQTEPLEDTNGYAKENSELISKMVNSFSRDLLTLLNGSTSIANSIVEPASEQFTVASHSSKPNFTQTAPLDQHNETGTGSATQPLGFSQSVFSQIAGQAHAQAQASLLSFTMEATQTQVAFASERAKELYDTLGKMLAGEASVIELVPVFIRHLAAPTDLEPEILVSIMRVLYCMMHHSERLQQFLLITATPSDTPSEMNPNHTISTSENLMEHPRVTLPGLHFASLEDYLSSRNDHKTSFDATSSSVERASDQKQMRAKLLSALCRVIKNHLNDATVLESGMCVLSYWVDLGIANPNSQPDFKPLLTGNVIQEIVLAPKSLPLAKLKALNILSQLLHFSDIFREVEASAKKSLLFNRCAKLLAQPEPLTREMKMLQRQVIHVFLSIIMALPSTGTRFVLENTRGHVNDADGHRSVVFYIAQLLHRETFDARTMNAHKAVTISKNFHPHDPLLSKNLIQDAFTLVVLLVRYVDLSAELDGADHEHAFLSVLYYLSSATEFDQANNDSVAKTAKALMKMLTFTN